MSDSLELGSEDAENRVLSCMINEPLAPSLVFTSGMTRSDYAWEVNAIIHDAIHRVVMRGASVDVTILVEELNASDLLESVGGEEVVKELASSPHSIALINEYTEIIKDRAMRRRLMKSFSESSRVIFSEPDGRKTISFVQESVNRAFDSYLSTAFSGFDSSDLQQQWNSGELDIECIPYPYPIMNTLAKGRERGTLNIFAGYTSDGKTVVGVTSIIVGCRDGKKCCLLSLEMTLSQVTLRILAQVTGIDAHKISSKELNLEQEQKIQEAFEEINSWDLKIYCDPSITPDDFVSIQIRERFDLTVIDYLQRFDYGDYSEVPRMAKKFKNLALSTNSAIDLLSQVTPKQIQPGANPYTRPDNNSLFGGKATAHEADNIFYIYALRDAGRNWERTGKGLLINTKVRQGTPEWEIEMLFNHKSVAWEEDHGQRV